MAPGERWLHAALLIFGGVVFASWALVGLAHVDDRYAVDHVSGARIALAWHFNHGTLYPELFDGEVYGGTRFMPLPILLHGLAARLTGEYLISGKILSYGVMVALLAVAFGLLRRTGCPAPLAVALTAAIVVGQAGLFAGMGLRGDALPLVLQLLAVALIMRTDRPRGAAVVAGMLAALAFLAKLSAVWALVAIALWLLAIDRRRLTWFLGAYGVATAGLVGLVAVVTEGRLLDNVLGFGTAGVDGLRPVITAPYRLVLLAGEQAPVPWALVPVVGIAGWLAVRDRRASLLLLSWACAATLLVVVLSDVGTGVNQLLDVTVLTVLVAGELAGRTLRGDGGVAVRGVIAAVVIWMGLTSLATTLLPAAREAVEALGPTSLAYRADPLAGHATPETTLLSEDPYLPVSLGQTPVVVDPFMLLRIGERDPRPVDPLIDRIEARAFDLVVLVEPLDPVDREWWGQMHFGPRVVAALARSYRYTGRVQGYYLYEPVGDRSDDDGA